MKIEKYVLDRINMVEGEETTENIDILYEFLLDQGYNWLRRSTNYFHSSLDLANDVKYIIGAEISNLDFKYCMQYLEIPGESIDNGADGLMYYPISDKWYYKMKEWSNERKDKLRAEQKYKKMRKEIIEGTSNYIAI